jgi:hypothetical protein
MLRVDDSRQRGAVTLGPKGRNVVLVSPLWRAARDEGRRYGRKEI